MHEASIAQSLIELALRHLNGSRAISIKVRVGALSGVMPDALLFAFDAIKIGTPLEDTGLLIERVKPQGFCNICNEGFEFDGPYVFECPRCRGTDFKITKGWELELSEMEVDE